MHAPLARDGGYPADWPEPTTLGSRCEALAGTYANSGVLSAAGAPARPVSLSEVLNVPGTARHITLAVRTRKVDRHGDTFAELDVQPQGGTAVRASLPDCFCLRQTLACTKVTEAYWAITGLGVGGRQSNVYIAVAADRSLIARLQDYTVDVIVAVPVFTKREPWLRFPASDSP